MHAGGREFDPPWLHQRGGPIGLAAEPSAQGLKASLERFASGGVIGTGRTGIFTRDHRVEMREPETAFFGSLLILAGTANNQCLNKFFNNQVRSRKAPSRMRVRLDALRASAYDTETEFLGLYGQVMKRIRWMPRR